MNILLPWAWVLAFLPRAAALEATASHQLRQPSMDIAAAKALVRGTPDEARKRRLMDAISKFRAEICFRMKDEHGKDFASFEQCQEFMKTACNPGKDKQMDGDRKEVTSGEGYCEEFFPAAVKKAEAQIDKEDKEAAAKVFPVASSPAAGPGPGPAPAPAPAAKATAPAPAAGGPAPSPGPSGAPGPAPVPAPFTPGLSGGKPYGAIAEDEAYYYKKGGKDAGRLHMSADMKLPTQGYWGKLVEHNDGETQTGDWGQEFGPETEQSFRKVCKEHPDNPWCEGKGYHRHKSGCSTVATAMLPIVCVLVAVGAF